MRFRHKRIGASALAAVLAGAIAAGAISGSLVQVQASPEMMPGIETIVNETSGEKPFRILEIVDNKKEAEIGYYVSGQEPFLKLYEYRTKDESGQDISVRFSSIEEGLAMLPSEKLRREFVNNILLDDAGNILLDDAGNETSAFRDIRELCWQEGSGGNKTEDYPLSYMPYAEKYFLSEGESTGTGIADWKQVTFRDGKIREVSLTGHYEERPSGDGDYTKEKQTYYPIRCDVEEDKNKSEKYRENIEGFLYSEGEGASAPYYLEFEEVDNTAVNEDLEMNSGQKILEAYDYTKGGYGLYENVYTELTEELGEKIGKGEFTFPGESPDRGEGAVELPGTANNLLETVDVFSSGEEEAFMDGASGAAYEEEPAGEVPAGEIPAETVEPEALPPADSYPEVDVFGDGNMNAAPVAYEGGADANSLEDGFSDTGDDSSWMNSEGGAQAAGEDWTNGGTDFGGDGADPNAGEVPGAGDGVMPDAGGTGAVPDGEPNAGGDAGLGEGGDAPDAGGGTSDSGDGSGENPGELPADRVVSHTEDPENAGKATDPMIYVGRTLETYPYYRYYEAGDLAYVQAQAKKQSEEDASTLQNGGTILREDGDITNENGQYFYWMAEEDGQVIPNSLSVVAAKQHVSAQDIQKLPDLGYNYYYRVKSVWFCARKSSGTEAELKPEDYEYFGWYYAFYLENQDAYIRAEEGRTATHYISDAEYSYTPGIGGYDFIPGGLEEEGNQTFLVQVPGFYYRGGYTNHDWLKRYVFHLQPNTDGAFENFQIQVDTITREEFVKIYNVGTYASLAGEEIGAETFASAPSENTPEPEGTESIDADVFASSPEEDTLAVSEETIREAPAGEFSDGIAAADGVDFGDGAQPAPEEQFYSGTVYAAGETGEETDSGILPLKDYDLFYVNSTLDEAQGAEVALSGVPCIINQDKAGTADSGIVKAFLNLVKDTTKDADQHYVSQNIYFFNARSTQEGKEAAWLINREFHKNFNPDAYKGAEGPAEALQGFEEILEYIDSENRYRELGVSSADGSTEEDPGFSDGQENRVEPLGKEISQARAVEYILNYQYKRYIRKKNTIRVLEIQPAKSDGQLTEKQVLNLLGYGIAAPEVESVSVCSYENEDHRAENMFDGNLSTMWHTAWTNRDQDASHTISITLQKPFDLEGLLYCPRQNGESGFENGRFNSMKVSLYDERGNVLLQDYEQTFTYPGNINADQECTFGFRKGVKKIVISEIQGYGGHASCAELKFLTGVPVVEITTLTAAEYVGHIEDINARYDLIYIGDDGRNRNSLLNGSGSMLYSHIGDVRLVNQDFGEVENRLMYLMGQLDIDYVPVENPQPETITIKDRQVTVTRTKQIRSTEKYNTGENGGDGVGSLRGSGNDITAQQCREMMDFVKSGYPMIVGDSLLTDGNVNSATVDTASYYWEFLSQAVGYENVASFSEVTGGTKSLKFFGELTKPEIDFTDGIVPPEPPRMGETEDEEANRKYLTGEGLIYRFYVRNDTEALPANTTYDCNLYLDLNFDGNLSNLEEQASYLEIWDENGNALAPVNGKYELHIGKQYTVERKIPENYYKLITWKLELVSNRNTSVRTSVVGYAKRKNNSGTKQVINVLHIMPDEGISAKLPGTWNLFENEAFQSKIRNIEDFDIQIKAVTVSEYEKDPSMLDNKQMLILGFDDVVQNISNDAGQVDKILKFIRSGRSALFAHDTTSFLNWDYRDTKETTVDGKSIKDNWIWGKDRADWGLSLNKFFRGLAGLDRYGITDTSHTIGEGVTFSQLLKAGKHLTNGSTVEVGDQSVTVDFSQLLKQEGDVAYVTGGDRTSSYLQTQGYTNGLVNNYNLGSNTTISATKVNDGAITQYPYRIPETMTVSATHGQYYQLAMEKDNDINGRKDGKNDIVVWYCLSGGIYSNSPNDVRNNYYFYSNGNVIYTGVGHSLVDQDIEMNLFINAIVAAANVTAVQPEVSFVKSLDPAAQEERFRYYMTDQADWASGDNLLEDDVELYFNVRDYNMVSSSLSQEDLAKQDMTVQFFVEDAQNGEIPTTIEGEELPTAEKLSDITAHVGTITQYGADRALPVDEDGKFHLSHNTTYGFRISDVEQFLYDKVKGEYAPTYPVYVRVTSTVSLYGESVIQSSWAKIDLKQRLLFELD